jgi:septum formation protein
VKPLILASQSASRQAMLRAAGIDFTAEAAHIDETAVKTALLADSQPPRNIADALAEMKAMKIAARRGDALVIGSDSIASVDGQLFDKPASRADAAAHLATFSGRELHLTSAVVGCAGGSPIWRHFDTARLSVRALSADFIESYLDAEWPAISGCVGCFRIEGPGVQLFGAVRGDYFSILGMPLLPLLGWLRQMGVMAS